MSDSIGDSVSQADKKKVGMYFSTPLYEFAMNCGILTIRSGMEMAGKIIFNLTMRIYKCIIYRQIWGAIFKQTESPLPKNPSPPAMTFQFWFL